MLLRRVVHGRRLWQAFGLKGIYFMSTKSLRRDGKREERISTEIVVDAYGPQEQAMSWYYYLEQHLRFPFTAVCTTKRAISSLLVEDEVEVTGMPSENECQREMFVTIRWEKDGLAVPLSQLRPIKGTDDETQEAVGDWHYWSKAGYQFG